jgi:hypothetical protein
MHLADGWVHPLCCIRHETNARFRYGVRQLPVPACNDSTARRSKKGRALNSRGGKREEQKTRKKEKKSTPAARDKNRDYQCSVAPRLRCDVTARSHVKTDTAGDMSLVLDGRIRAQGDDI